MKVSAKLFILMALLAGGAFWLFNQFQVEDTPLQQNNALGLTINACDAITEKAAANLVAVVETQKLEIAGRKAHVFRMCMSDRGYKENPVWTKFAAPIAAQKAKSENTSVDEAFENLRRTDMMLYASRQGEPLFWVAN